MTDFVKSDPAADAETPLLLFVVPQLNYVGDVGLYTPEKYGYMAVVLLFGCQAIPEHIFANVQ